MCQNYCWRKIIELIFHAFYTLFYSLEIHEQNLMKPWVSPKIFIAVFVTKIFLLCVKRWKLTSVSLDPKLIPDEFIFDRMPQIVKQGLVHLVQFLDEESSRNPRADAITRPFIIAYKSLPEWSRLPKVTEEAVWYPLLHSLLTCTMRPMFFIHTN